MGRRRDDLVKAVTVLLAVAADMTDDQAETVGECECLMCTTMHGAMMIYRELEAANAEEAKKCLH